MAKYCKDLRKRIARLEADDFWREGATEQDAIKTKTGWKLIGKERALPKHS